MPPPDREPCPRCGEPTPDYATACPFCKAGLLVDVGLPAPVSDARARYQLARAIASLGPPAPDFSAAQRALEEPVPVLARGLSRLAARNLQKSLADFGLAATVEAAGTVAPARPGRARWLAMAAVLAVVVAAVAVSAMRTGTSPSVRSSKHPSSLARERSIPWSTPSVPLSLKDLTAVASPGVVEVRCNGRLSAGFLAAPDLVLTGSLRTDGCTAVELRLSRGESLTGQVTARDPWLGLAVVQVQGVGAEPLRLGDASVLHGGDRVLLPANGELREARMGAAARQFQGVAHLPLAADVRPEDAGGPVLDFRGYVVGVIAPPEATGGEPFLLPINYIYDESHLVPRPEPGPSLKKWKALLAQVAVAEKLHVEATPAQEPESSAPPSNR